MSIESTEILEDSPQANGYRHIRIVHIDHVGGRHPRAFMIAPDKNLNVAINEDAFALNESLINQELAANESEAFEE
jgi:hypothetical protein